MARPTSDATPVVITLHPVSLTLIYGAVISGAIVVLERAGLVCIYASQNAQASKDLETLNQAITALHFAT